MAGLPLRDSFLWQNFVDRHSDIFIDDRDSASDSGNGDDESAILDLMDDLSSWSHLPDIVLEQVYSYLSLRDRYHASLVCKNWYQVFYSPAIWRKLVMTANAFTHKRYTPHKGYWTELSHHKVQMCLKKVGSYIQTIVIEPISEFYNLYEFLRIWNMFLEYHVKQYPMESLNSFCFTFCCESREQSEVFIYGTGGKLLEELKRLLNNLWNLKTLKLNNLMLELSDAPGVLEPVVHRCPSITYLEIRNYTKELYPLFVASMFRNLRTLVISPQHLNSFMVLRLAESKVNNLHIVQDHYCDEQYFIEPETWKVVSEKAQNLNIYLCVEGQSAMEVNWQEGAPVTAITYTSKFSRVFPMSVDSICCRYSTTLQMYGHYNLPRFHGARSFHDRCDGDLVKLVRHCRKLHTLIIRDRISTASLIIIAREGKQLRHLLVRKNSIIKRCDWSRAGSWDENFYWTMRRASHSYEDTFAEVSRCLGYSWQPLTDKMFMRLLPPHLSLNTESDIDTS